MAINLESSPKFREDFNNLRDRISKINNNESLKSELESLLRVLVTEVRSIDVMHGELTMHRELSEGVLNSRSRLLETRKKIIKKLESWERANP